MEVLLETYQDARSIEALKDKLAQPARWLAGVACTAVLGGGAALGFHLLGVNNNMSIGTRTNTTVAGGVTVGIIGGLSGVSIAEISGIRLVLLGERPEENLH